MAGGPRVGVGVKGVALAVLAGALACPTGRARGEAKVLSLTDTPILVNNINGHSAPVLSLVFAPDGKVLFSGGLDKVVHVWNLGEKQKGVYRARRHGTLRPPIWSGRRGSIYALAVARKRDGADGTYLLAAAGLGVRSSLPGEILVLQYPGPKNAETGEVVAQLPKTSPPAYATEHKHNTNVTALAFSPDGRYLASAERDGQVFLWDLNDLNDPRPVKVPTWGSQVNAVAFGPKPDFPMLYVCGALGRVERIDVSNPAAPRWVEGVQTNRFTRPESAGAGALDCLAVSPDGESLVVGENYGAVLKFNAKQLDQAQPIPEDGRPVQWVHLVDQEAGGEVKSLAFNRDGSRLAVAGMARKPRDFGDVVVDGSVRVVRFPDGAPLETIRSAEPVWACQFHPVDDTLAYSGGERHSIYLTHAADLVGERVVTLKGSGWTLRDVGFAPVAPGAKPALVVGVPGEPNDHAQAGLKEGDAPRSLLGFDFLKGAYTAVDPTTLVRALKETDGPAPLHIRPTGPWTLRVEDKDGRGWPIELDPHASGRWYCYGFIRPDAAAGHPGWTVAVGTANGVGIYRWNANALERVRFLHGHGGEVTSLAASPDGRWLATTSTDQTVRLWTLKGCDQLPRLGATLRPAAEGAGYVVDDVTPGGQADRLGLANGDVIDKCTFPGRVVPPTAELLKRNEEGFPGGFTVAFEGHRGVGAARHEILTTTSFFEAPALSLFLGPHDEWVLWSASGWYDTNWTGASEFLGWHKNMGRTHKWEPSSHQKAGAFESFRKPDVLRRIAATGDTAPPVAEKASPEKVVVTLLPPSVDILQPRPPTGEATLEVKAETVALVADVTAIGPSAIASYEVQVNGTAVPALTRTLETKSRRQAIRGDVPLIAGQNNTLTVKALNEQGISQTTTVTIRNTLRLRHDPQMFVLAVGVDGYANWPKLDIPKADVDAEDVWEFFRKHADRDEKGNKEDGFKFAADLAPINGNPRKPDVATIRDVLNDLKLKVQSRQVHAEDTVVVFLETHLRTLDRGKTHVFLASDSAEAAPEAAVPASEVGDCLKELKRKTGCMVILLLDVYHENTPLPAHKPESTLLFVKDWAGDLGKNNVVVALAAKDGTSRRGRTNGAFAEAIVNSMLSLPAGREPQSMTLEEFRDILSEQVKVRSRRGQHAGVFLPEKFNTKTFLRAKASKTGGFASRGR